MLKYNLTGVPALNGPTGIFADAEKAVEITQASSPEVSIGSAIRAVFAMVTSAAYMVIDPIARKLLASDYTDIGGQSTNCVVLNPLDGQTGRSLVWEKQPAVGTVPADLVAALAAIIAPVPPKRSAESMVQAILDSIPEAYKDRIQVGINQQDARVYVRLLNDAADRAADYAMQREDVMTHGNTVEIVFSGEATNTETVGDTSLPFEGGLISQP